MNKLSLKNYPPAVLVIIVCLVAAVNLGFKVLWQVLVKQKEVGFGQELLIVLLSYSTVLTLLGLVNQYLMWEWYLKLLKLPDMRGNYTGELISSYHIGDLAENPHIRLFCKVRIIQNINAFKIKGDFFSDETFTTKSSDFNTFWEEVKKDDDGEFTLRYFFESKGNQLHPGHQQYGLNNHQGACVMTFDPKTVSMHGYYFNHERSSYGIIKLQRQSLRA